MSSTIRLLGFLVVSVSLCSCLTSEVKLGQRGKPVDGPSTINAEASPVPIPCSNKLPGFLTLDLSGGAPLAGWDFAPLDKNEEELSDYSRMGQPAGSGYTLNYEFGLPYFEDRGQNATPKVETQTSHFVLGMLSKIPAYARNNIRIFGIAARTYVNSAQPMNAGDLVYRSGAQGIFLKTRTGYIGGANTSGGLATLPPTANSPYMKLGYQGEAPQAATRTDCSKDSPLEPSMAVNADLNSVAASLYGLPTSVTRVESFANIVLNSTLGYSGPGTIYMTGYGFINQTRALVNQREREAGEQVGLAIALAAAMGRPLYIAVVTDGGKGSLSTTTPLDPNFLTEKHSLGLGIYYNPNEVPKLTKLQIGNYDATTLELDLTSRIGNSALNVSFVHFLNWLKVAGLQDNLKSLLDSPGFPKAGFPLTPENADELLAFE